MILSISTQTGASFRLICDVLEFPRSSFYHASKPTITKSKDIEIGEKVEAIFWKNQKRYGVRRIRKALADQEIYCGYKRISRLMKEMNLKAIQPKSYVPTTSDGKATKPSPNLLLERNIPSELNRVWTGDITYIRINGGWHYLSIVMDLCSRKIVGWDLQDNMEAGLVVNAFEKARATRLVKKELIFHSDRGSQYGSQLFRDQLGKLKAIQSMSGKANPYDNAWTESVIGTIKKELLEDEEFESFEEAKMDLFEYIEGYYNVHRKHSKLDYQSPAEFEAKKTAF